MRPDGSAPESVAVEFDAWVAESVTGHDLDALIAAPTRAPAFRLNHPTTEHWLPVLVAAGAATAGDTVEFPVAGFEYGNLSRRAMRFG
jgi:4,5-DOPA dioxygenase extradiol